jgi:hypothetical protein
LIISLILKHYSKNWPITVMFFVYEYQDIVLSFFVVHIFFIPSLLIVENWVLLHFSISHVQTQSNRGCNFHVILLWFMLPRDHHFSRFFINTFNFSQGRTCAIRAVRKVEFSLTQFVRLEAREVRLVFFIYWILTFLCNDH